MKGYKALDQNMRASHGDGMKYVLGKSYSVNGKVVLCKNGFHLCEKIEELNAYYNISKSRIFEVEAKGYIERGDMKCAAQKIKLSLACISQAVLAILHKSVYETKFHTYPRTHTTGDKRLL